MNGWGLMRAGLLAALAGGGPALARSPLVFDNQSGEPALVQLVGPTATLVRVPKGAALRLAGEPGRYYLKVRYGWPEQYRYVRGESFAVQETATSALETVIRLRPVQTGNYHAESITKEAFETAELGDVVWARMVRHPTLRPAWAAGEAAYREAVARGAIPATGRPDDLIGFGDMIRRPLGGNLARRSVQAQFGPPRRIFDDAGMTWMDYGAIQLGMAPGSEEVSTFRALRRLYVRGFAASAGPADSAAPAGASAPPT